MSKRERTGKRKSFLDRLYLRQPQDDNPTRTRSHDRLGMHFSLGRHEDTGGGGQPQIWKQQKGSELQTSL